METLTYHGGRIDLAMRRFPHAPQPWLDLSTGINAESWQPEAALTVDLRALPSVAGLEALCRAAAAALDAPEVAIAALPGTEIALRMLAGIGLPAPFHHAVPGYRTHGAVFGGATGFAIDAIEAVAAGGGTMLIANPNNPDGQILPPERLLAVARTLARRGGVLVVDEAYADAVPGVSVLPHLRPGDRVLVLRSFGKFFGLAGVRLGFACGAAELVARIATQAGSWPVSATALAYGEAAYRDAAWIAAMRARLGAAATALDGVLRAAGREPIGDCPLFRMIRCADAEALFVRLAQAGILIRPYDDAPDRLRIGVPGDAAALARLAAALHGG